MHGRKCFTHAKNEFRKHLIKIMLCLGKTKIAFKTFTAPTISLEFIVPTLMASFCNTIMLADC